MRGMTGYGFHREAIHGRWVSFSVTSVNRKHLEITTKLPQQFAYLDSKIKKAIQDCVQRGHLHVYMVSEELSQEEKLSIDMTRVDRFIHFCEAVADRVSASISPHDVWKQIVANCNMYYEKQKDEPNASLDGDDEYNRSILSILKKAIDSLIIEKMNEGEVLSRYLEQHIHVLQQNIGFIKERIGSQAEIIAQIKRKLDTILQKYISSDIHHDDKMMREVVLLADKSDISEEIDRIEHHLSSLLVLISKNLQNSLGKRIEFILQELLREYNTLGSKSDVIEIIERVIEAKTELEKLREQVQNVE